MLKIKNKIYYVAELNLPNKSAYSIHVMKMCEAFSKLDYNLELFVINKKSYNSLYRNYNIKNKFKIFSIFHSQRNLNFIFRLIFSLKILSFKFEKDSIFLSRSIIFALIASVLRKNVILELHHEITGFSKIFYILFKHLKLIQNLKFIFLHKELNKIYKIDKSKIIILDDAVNIENFKQKKSKKFKKTCVYIGSFFEGKGIEQVFRLAKLNPNINFHIYGEKKYLFNKNYTKNIKIFNYVNYSKIPKILSCYEVALMPYQKKVKGRSSIWLEKYMSPLKMFDYLAAKMIIIASDLGTYRHILKNNFNCKLVKVNNDNKWSETLIKVFQNNKQNKLLKINAGKTANKFTWDNRSKKIISFARKSF